MQDNDASDKKKPKKVATKKAKGSKSKKSTPRKRSWFQASEYMLRGRPEGVPRKPAAKKRKHAVTKTGKKAVKKVKLAHGRKTQPRDISQHPAITSFMHRHLPPYTYIYIYIYTPRQPIYLPPTHMPGQD